MSADQPAAALVWCPFPDADSARRVAGQMLDEALIACANILGPVESHFIWHGERSSAAEIPVLFKSTAAHMSLVVARLGALHPYDTPVIIGWRCDSTHPATMAWLSASCAASGRSVGMPESPAD